MARIKRIVERDRDGTVLSVQDRTAAPTAAVIRPAMPDPPTIAEMVGNFAGSMLRWAGSGFATVDEVAFRLRLERCRGCEFWDEAARAGAGKCNHPKCGCTKAKLWLASERCPIARW